MTQLQMIDADRSPSEVLYQWTELCRTILPAGGDDGAECVESDRMEAVAVGVGTRTRNTRNRVPKTGILAKITRSRVADFFGYFGYLENFLKPSISPFLTICCI